MYLVHARLRSAAGTAVPADVADIVTRHADADTGLEHVSVHNGAGTGLVLGLFLLARSLEAAECSALQVCLHALSHAPQLRAFTLLQCSAEAPFAYYEELLVGEATTEK
ncbi:hypothetical protein ACFV2H_24695 [Streptomyces sp. NPDC059629]|uniref:hypothetical protein n=1 Tax=Streptomyces sp. NPDC059629 TaxID=3346889 RepID=UPI0036BFE677